MRSKHRTLAFLLALAASCTSSTPAPSPAELLPWEANELAGADLVLLHGRIATVDPARPFVTAIAMRGDRIVAVGGDAEIMQHVTERTRRIDLHGRFAMPGFVEGHGHFLGVGDQKLQLDL